MKAVSFLYQLARFANDLSCIFRPKRIPKRLANKLIGRKLVRKVWWK